MSDEHVFSDRGQEFFTADGNLIWPARHRELRDFAGKGVSLAEDSYVRQLLGELDTLEQKTRPSIGSESAKGKDLAAFRTLKIARQLVEHVAGWAIDHQIGLASEGLKFVPLQPSAMKNHPQYLEKRASVDSHDHEKTGGVLTSSEGIEPFFARKCLVNVLRANPGAMPGWLRDKTIEGLEALDYGEVQPIFAPINEGRKRDLTELRLQLQALAMVAYRRKLGLTKEKALEQVAYALSKSPNTILSWETRLRNEFGRLEVDRTLTFAENHASYVAAARKNALRGEPVEDTETHETMYDDAALRELNDRFKAATGAGK
jgi:hypothetical protein